MTEPQYPELMTLATPYALHAISSDEQNEIDRQLANAPELVARAFADEVRAVRETMAVVSTATAVEPPERVRRRLLSTIGDSPAVASTPGPSTVSAPSSRWRTFSLAVAAAVVVGLGAVGVGLAVRSEVQPPAAEQILAAPDVKTVSGAIPTGGTATVAFSRERNAAVLTMNGVDPPGQGTVYQMWLVGDDGPHSAGTMDAGAISPRTTAVLSDLGDSTSLAFTVEPSSGSSQPTHPAFAQLRLA